jgi:hypothetical protein
MEKETIIKILDFIEKKENKLSSKSSKFINKIKFIERLESGIPFTKEELNIKGNLYLNGTDITSLPEGLKVGGDLRLDGLEINLLPKGLEVGDDLFINNTPLTKYKQNKLKEMIYPGFIKGQITIDR